MLQDVNWSSQAELTLNSPPKCFVGWLENGLATCDSAEVGEWCDCGANWDDDITLFKWKNTTYNKLTWTTTESMLSVNPATPILAQAFFKCK